MRFTIFQDRRGETYRLDQETGKTAHLETYDVWTDVREPVANEAEKAEPSAPPEPVDDIPL